MLPLILTELPALQAVGEALIGSLLDQAARVSVPLGPGGFRLVNGCTRPSVGTALIGRE